MKFKILVIDDEKNIREGLQMALEDEGYEVLTAELMDCPKPYRKRGTLLSPTCGCRESAVRKVCAG